MSKKFDAEAYVNSWDAKVIPVMIGTILISLVLAVVLNVKTRPDCIRHEYVFCGTEEVLEGEGHHAAAAGEEHGAAGHDAGHHEEGGAHGPRPEAPEQNKEQEHQK